MNVTIHLTETQVLELLSIARDLKLFLRSKRYIRDRADRDVVRNGVVDPWVDLLPGEVEQISTRDLMTRCLGLTEWSASHAQRLGRCMRHLGYDGPRNMRIAGVQVKGYKRREAAPPSESEAWGAIANDKQ